MRFILTATGLEPTDGAIAPFIGEKIGDAASDVAGTIFLNIVHGFGAFLVDKGLPILAEGCFVFSLFCFLMAIAGTGKWMERGVKSILASVMIGVLGVAV